MPRFFFDIHDGELIIDDQGTLLPSRSAVRTEAMRALPEIANDEIPKYGDHQAFAVFVRDEDGNPVYSSTLTYTGMWLLR